MIFKYPKLKFVGPGSGTQIRSWIRHISFRIHNTGCYHIVLSFRRCGGRCVSGPAGGRSQIPAAQLPARARGAQLPRPHLPAVPPPVAESARQGAGGAGQPAGGQRGAAPSGGDRGYFRDRDGKQEKVLVIYSSWIIPKLLWRFVYIGSSRLNERDKTF